MCDMFPPSIPVHHHAELNLLRKTRLPLASAKTPWLAVAVLEAGSHAWAQSKREAAARESPVGYRSSAEFAEAART